MKNKYLSYVILAIVCYATTGFTNENDISKRTKQIKNEIVAHFVSYRYLSKRINFALEDVVAFPICQVSLRPEEINDKLNISDKLKIDTLRAVGIVYHDNSPFYIVREINGRYSYNVLDSNEVKNDRINEQYKFELIQYVKKLGTDPFFIEFPHNDDCNEKLVGYFDNGTLRFAGSFYGKVALYKNFTELVSNLFGSKEKYIETLKEQMVKDSMKRMMSVDRAKMMYAKDYAQRRFTLPKDTIENLNLMVEYIHNLVPLNQYQKAKIKYKILNRLKMVGINMQYYGTWAFYGLSTEDILYDTLTEEQYYLLIKKNKIQEEINKAARNKLYQYFKSNGLSEDKTDEALKNILQKDN